MIRIGCAGWAIPRQHAAAFPELGSHLERYARRFSAVEINSSFYRPHRTATYGRWAASVPAGFAFAVKAPRAMTHQRRLADADAALVPFLAEVAALGARLGPLLFQLPPNLDFASETAASFSAALRARFDGAVALEPRHASWFSDEAERLLADFRIARVAANPAIVPRAAGPGGWSGFAYYRLHGAPRMYYSAYEAAMLASLASQVAETARGRKECWCIFDNTALGAATANALALQELVDIAS